MNFTIPIAVFHADGMETDDLSAVENGGGADSDPSLLGIAYLAEAQAGAKLQGHFLELSLFTSTDMQV